MLLSLVDDNVYAFMRDHAPKLAWLGQYRVASLIVCIGLYVATGPAGSYRLPVRSTRWRLVALIAAFWFVPAIVMVYVVRVPVPALHTAADFVAFLVTGLLAEELLFRGAIYQLAERVLPRTMVNVSVPLPLYPIALSAICFSLAHFQYHHFALTSASLSQVSYTLIMGVLWGTLRPLSSSMWPAVCFHLLTNLLSLPRII